VRFSLLLVWLVLVFAAGWPLLTSFESLWVDELHSAWVIDGPWNEVAHRATIGNQSSLYFGCLKLFQNVLSVVIEPFGWSIPNEVSLRLFSWLGWVAMIGFIAYPQRHSRSIILVLALWLWLDRIGSFYAIETRPYAWVAFFSLLLMTSAIRIAAAPLKIHWLWVLWAMLLFYCHYTSLIVIALSMSGVLIELLFSSLSRDRSGLKAIIRSRIVEAVAFFTLATPGLVYLSRIGEQSQQWNDFAGDQSLHAFFDLFPWFAWCLVPALFLLVERVCDRSPVNPETAQRSDLSEWRKNQTRLIQAAVVGLGGIMIVWSLTCLGIAPLMHRRYAIGTYPAFLTLGAVLLNQMRYRSVLFGAAIVSLAILGVFQGTFREWREGRWLAWQRQEDWRMVHDYLKAKTSPEETVFVAPMLIETKGSQLSIYLPHDYLTAPLRTLYRVPKSHSLIPLPNDRRGWFEPLTTILNEFGRKGAWVVVRSSQVDRFAGSYTGPSSEDASKKTVVLTPKLNAGRVQLFYARMLHEE
jgi:mannosyltransferase